MPQWNRFSLFYLEYPKIYISKRNVKIYETTYNFILCTYYYSNIEVWVEHNIYFIGVANSNHILKI